MSDTDVKLTFLESAGNSNATGWAFGSGVPLAGSGVGGLQNARPQQQMGGNISFAQSLGASQPATPLDLSYVVTTLHFYFPDLFFVLFHSSITWPALWHHLNPPCTVSPVSNPPNSPDVILPFHSSAALECCLSQIWCTHIYMCSCAGMDCPRCPLIHTSALTSYTLALPHMYTLDPDTFSKTCTTTEIIQVSC